jgi:hypothetical protein
LLFLDLAPHRLHNQASESGFTNGLTQAELERAAELLRAGADINARDQCGDFILEEVIKFNDDVAERRSVVTFMLDHLADPNREHEGCENLYDWAEFDYRHETYDFELPEEPKDEDKSSEAAWLQYLDRLALKYNKRRPDYLFLLRERGALTYAEQKHLQARGNL